MALTVARHIHGGAVKPPKRVMSPLRTIIFHIPSASTITLASSPLLAFLVPSTAAHGRDTDSSPALASPPFYIAFSRSSRRRRASLHLLRSNGCVVPAALGRLEAAQTTNRKQPENIGGRRDAQVQPAPQISSLPPLLLLSLTFHMARQHNRNHPLQIQSSRPLVPTCCLRIRPRPHTFTSLLHDGVRGGAPYIHFHCRLPPRSSTILASRNRTRRRDQTH
ncbi:hypothetical protein R3P38DRAFT_3172972 [Favolaschia claudopus]|uniref:Uncharacterized protein n=1 Tax=Favolaschia claudopus TaxID=2862362 RepID=A0AAW0DJI0_9AGAR